MAATQKRTPCLRLLLSVTQAEDEHRVVEVLQKNGIPLCFEARAKGTAPSELLDAIGLGGTVFLVLGGVSYTIGAMLYVIGKKKNKRYVHSIFHLFVVLGSLLHFFCVLFYVM